MMLLFTSITVNLFVLLVLMTTCKSGKSTLKTLTVATLYSVTTCCHKGSSFYIHVFILNVLDDCYHFFVTHTCNFRYQDISWGIEQQFT